MNYIHEPFDFFYHIPIISDKKKSARSIEKKKNTFETIPLVKKGNSYKHHLIVFILKKN